MAVILVRPPILLMNSANLLITTDNLLQATEIRLSAMHPVKLDHIQAWVILTEVQEIFPGRNYSN